MFVHHHLQRRAVTVYEYGALNPIYHHGDTSCEKGEVKNQHYRCSKMFVLETLPVSIGLPI